MYDLVKQVSELSLEKIDVKALALLITAAQAIVTEAENAKIPRCSCCGTTDNLHEDYGSGGPYRCDSVDCVVF